MKDWILALKIRAKLLIAFGSILLFSVLLLILSIGTINRILDNKSASEKVEELKLAIESQELALKEFVNDGYKEKDFQEKGTSPFIEAFSSNYQTAIGNLKRLEGDENELQTQTKSILRSLNNIRNEFDSLQLLLQLRGFKDYGLEGSLRKSIHEVENSSFKIDKVGMLTLRRNEKDYLLRKDLKYRDDFLKNLESFKQTTRQLKEPGVAELLYKIDNYRDTFLKVVELEISIGLKNEEGIRGELAKNVARLKPPVAAFSNMLKARNEKQIRSTITFLAIIFTVQLIAGIFLAIFYAGLITNAIKEIRNAMQALANGAFPEKLKIRTTEEIGQTKIALNMFLDRLQSASQFAHRIGDGDLAAVYDTRFENDVLAKSIIQMQQKLREAEEKQSKINWVNVGTAQFAEIIKNESDNIQLLADKILSTMVKYLGLNQGALYILEHEKLTRIATYAYDKKRFLDQTIDLGSGLVGQCAMEKETIYLKQIPADYVRITSGLGEATPNNLVLVPIKLRENVLGVIELASFKVLESYKVQFIENLSESIASLLFNKQTAAKTEMMLRESEDRANVMSQQEEEMRQNAEELQATQEEMARQKLELEEEIVLLHKQIKASHD
jgi:HAMP domain-containing protein